MAYVIFTSRMDLEKGNFTCRLSQIHCGINVTVYCVGFLYFFFLNRFVRDFRSTAKFGTILDFSHLSTIIFSFIWHANGLFISGLMRNVLKMAFQNTRL